MTALDWSILAVAGSSLVFAVLAFKQVMFTTSRINTLLDKLPKNPLKAITPDFMAEVVAKTITSGVTGPDGRPVKVHDVVNGYVLRYGPVMKEMIRKELPTIARAVFSESPPTPSGGGQDPASSAGQALAAQRWGGGLKAAKGLGKAAKKLGFSDKAQEMVEVVTVVRDAIPMFKEIKASISGNGGEGSPAPAQASGGNAGEVWCPQ